jgi:hypothetical protein
MVSSPIEKKKKTKASRHFTWWSLTQMSWSKNFKSVPKERIRLGGRSRKEQLKAELAPLTKLIKEGLCDMVKKVLRGSRLASWPRKLTTS